MTWPWVSRKLYRVATRTVSEMAGRIAELRAQLERSESERREAQLQMLRLSNGLPIFPEQLAAQKQIEQPASEAIPQLSFATMDELEINSHLVAEAKRMGCVTMPQVIAHVNRRKKELWREEHPEPNHAEARARAAAVSAVEEALAEGAASAQKSVIPSLEPSE